MHDYVIVGAGSAGCVLARRLADAGHSVALLEAGPARQRAMMVRSPALYFRLWRGKLDWAFTTEPQVHADGRRMFWPRGKVVGGSSCLNASVYIRGHRGDYDGWRDLDCPGWGWDDVLPLFRRSERNQRGASEHHGGDGLLPVTDLEEPSPLADPFVAAATSRCGVAETDDFNRGDPEGFGRYQFTAEHGERASTAVTFLHDAPARLEVRSGVLVSGLIVEDQRVRGVRCRVRGRDEEVRAAREVVLCGGAIGSPHLLLLSGIGPADQLRHHGLDVIADLPGVGQNLQDHLFYGLGFAATDPGVRRPSLVRALGWMLRYRFGRGGPLRKPPVEVGGFVRSTPDQPRPDIQFHVMPWAIARPNTDEDRPDPTTREMTIFPGLIYPRSTGELRLASADPGAAPVIDPRYFADDADLAHLVRGVELTREIAATEPLAGHLGGETFPGAACADEEAIRAAIRAGVNTIFHPVGTCKMGVDEAAVVDAELRVRGLDGVRVADASIMPRIVGGNTNAPVIMIAEKAADLMLAEI